MRVWLAALVVTLLLASATGRSLPQPTHDQALLQAREADEKDAPCVRFKEEWCDNKEPPILRRPIVAMDDDREGHLTVSWESIPAEYNVSAYTLQMSTEFGNYDTVYEGLDTLWETDTYDRALNTAFRARVRNCAAQADWSDVVSLEATPILDAPKPPRIANVTSTSADVRWIQSFDSPHSMSILEYRTDSAAPPVGARSTLWSDWQDGYGGDGLQSSLTGLRPGSWYWLRLAFLDGESARTWSPMVAFQTPTDVPYKPRIEGTQWLNRDRTRVNITWNTDYDGGQPIEAYTLYMASDLDDDVVSVYHGPKRQFAMDMTPGVHYTFQVKATNLLGDSPLSRYESVVCPARPANAVPIPVTVERSQTSIKVRWQPPDFDGGAQVTRYALERGDGLGLKFTTVFLGMGFEFESEHLFPSTTYRFRVKAINSQGDSLPSPVLAVKTQRKANVCPGGEDADTSCFGNGSCEPTQANCTCDSGWILSDCSGKPCPNNCTHPEQGMCDYATGMCKCINYYTGLDCARQDLSHKCPDSCNNGHCDPFHGVCDCDPGFAGYDCTEFDCMMHGQCNGHGSCESVGNCACEEGYLAPDCAQASCLSLSACNGHGQCDRPNHCACMSAYLDADCGSSLCGPTDCSGHGYCVGTNQCHCDDGYVGQHCEKAVCPQDCSGNGECVEPGQCVCEEGWIGMDCGTAICLTVDSCNGRGNCSAPETCSCNPGWADRTCDRFVCQSDCSGHGACVGPLNCVCDAGWNGPACSIPDCDKVHHCSGNGNCTAPNVCTCQLGWEGKSCDQAQCDRVKNCNARGDCIFPQVCKCHYGFDGAECEIRTKPTNVLVFPTPADSLDFVRPLPTNMTGLTVEGWFNISGLGARVNLIAQRDVLEVYATRKYAPGVTVPLNEFGDAVNPVVVHARVSTPSGSETLSREVYDETNTYHYLAVTVDTSTVKIYVDGEVVGSQATPGAPSVEHLASSSFTLTGAGGVVHPEAVDRPLITMAAVRVWATARTLKQIQANMIAGARDAAVPAVPDPDVFGFWRFDDELGAYAGDASGHKRTARLIGEPQFELVPLPEVKPPSAPLMVEHEVLSSNTIRVMWEAPAENNGATVGRYTLEYSLDFVEYQQIYEGPDLEHQVTSLSRNRFYAFRAIAHNFAGASPHSEVSYFGTSPGGPQPPKHPVKLETAGPTQLEITWVRPKCNGSLLTNYTIDVMDTRSHVRVLAKHIPIGAPRKTTLNGLLPGVTYDVRVRGVNDIGNGAWSAPSLLTTTAAAPGAPLWGHVEHTSHTVTLQWAPALPNGDAVRRYEIQRRIHAMRDVSPLAAAPPPPESPAQHRANAQMRKSLAAASSFLEVEAGAMWANVGQVSGFTTHYVDEDAVPAAHLTYRVRAENDAGAGQWTEIRVTTLAAVPDAPVVVAKDVAHTTATIKWLRPAANGPAVFAYKMQLAVDGPAPVWETKYEGDQLSAKLSGLSEGTMHLVRVFARNCKGWSAPSPPLTVVTKSLPPDAPPVAEVRKRSPRAIVLTWTRPYSYGKRDVTHVLEMRVPGGKWQEVYTGLDTNFTVRDLTPASPYDFRVAGISIVGRGAYSAVVSAHTPAGPPEAPEGRVVAQKPTSLTIRWDEPANNGLRIKEYHVYYGERDAAELHEAVVTNATQETVRGLKADTIYRLRVRAINEAGASDYHEVETRTPPARPKTPLPPTVLAKGVDWMELDWEQRNTSIVRSFATTWQLDVFIPHANMTHKQQVAALDQAHLYHPLYRGPLTRFNASGLLSNRQYFFRLKGINNNGAGDFSSVVSYAPLESNAQPDSPKNLVLSRYDGESLAVAWEPQGSDNVLPVLEYVVERTQPFPWDVSLDGTRQGWLQPPFDDDLRTLRMSDSEIEYNEVYRGEPPNFVIGGLLSGHAYGVRVRTVNVMGDSVPSATLVFHTSPGQPSTAAVPELVARSATELRVEWDRPADGGADIDEYTVVVDGVSNFTTPDRQRFFVAKNLVPGSEHTFAVVASNQFGSVTGPTIKASTLNGAPFAPAKPLVKSGEPSAAGLPTFDITWSAADTAGTPVTAYTLEMRDPFLEAYRPIVHNELVFDAHVEGDIQPEAQYAFRLTAHSAAGVSASSPPVVVFSSSVIPHKPPAPRLQGVTATTALLTWDDETAGQNEFELRAGPSPEQLSVVYRSLGTSTMLEGLNHTSRVIAQLRAINTKGAGPWSDALVFTTESTCMGDDGVTCSARGACVEGKCECFRRYTGVRCEDRIDRGVCAAWGGGHILTVDEVPYTTTAVGEYVAYATSPGQAAAVDELEVEVRMHMRPVEFLQPQSPALDSVAVRVGTQVLTLSTSRRSMRASNNVYVRLDCGPSFGLDVRKEFERGMDIPGSPFHVRVDVAHRFIVSVAGSGIKVIVQPWLYEDRYFLNAVISDAKPRLGLMRGLCGAFGPLRADARDAAKLPAPVASDGELADAVWVSQWLVPSSENITQCREDTNPAFDTTPPLHAPTGNGTTSANDDQTADAEILLLELDESTSHASLADVCGDADVKSKAAAGCAAVRSQPEVYSACMWDVCATGGSYNLLASHADARRVIGAVREAIEAEGLTLDAAEALAADEGMFAQPSMPVCPQ